MEKYEGIIGTVLDNRYRIDKLCGVGGMAIVFKAEDVLMKRTVAIKMLKEDMSNDMESVHRFINESKAVAMLSHENIVNIYDVSVKEKQKYIVMEYIEGINLKSYIKRKGGMLTLEETFNIIEQILSALDHAHSKGIVHRDIKPQNVLVLKNGVIKVADFGIAQLPDGDNVTPADKAIGTVHYVSPEQASGKDIDHKSDLYSLGVVLYEMVCGRLPFDGESSKEIVGKQIRESPPKPREVNPEIPKGLEQIILRAMEKSPDRRYQSAKQMMKHIGIIKENPTVRFRTPEEAALMRDKNKNQKHKNKNNKNNKTLGKKKAENGADDGSCEKKNQHVVVRGTSLMPTVYGVFFAFLIVVAIVVISLFYHLSGNMNLDDKKELQVVECVGQTYSEEYISSLEDMGFNVTVKFTSVVGEATELNTIINQDPPAGITKKYEDKVDLQITVYIGEETMSLPDFSMRKYTDVVVGNHKEYSFTFRETKEYSDIIPEGYIIRTDPPAGTEVKLDEIITVFVSKGEQTFKITVPQLIGMDGTEAIKLLAQMGIKVGDVKYLTGNEKRGTVIIQSIAANTQVPKYSVIDIVLSEGPSGGQIAPPDTDTSVETDGGIFDDITDVILPS